MLHKKIRCVVSALERKLKKVHIYLTAKETYNIHNLFNICNYEKIPFIVLICLAPLNRFKPSSKSIFTDRSKAVLLMWINFVSYASCWCVL